MTKDWTSGQLNALVKKVGGEKIARGILDGTVQFTVTEQKHLVHHNTIDLPELSKTFNPQEYYRNRTGLYVWDGFTDNILSVAKKTKKVSARKIVSYNLMKASNDAEICIELPENYVWEDASEFCAHLANMIDGQPNGKEGNFLSNGYTNIFYVCGKDNEVFAVHLSWVADGREWRVLAYRLVADRWGVGRRAFSCN